MHPHQKKKLIATNAGIWAIGIFASFVLPLIAQSLSNGPARFLQVLCFAIPLFVGMAMSTVVINKSIVETER